nr:hypothetical protein [Pantoea ananatis]
MPFVRERRTYPQQLSGISYNQRTI